MDGLFPVATRVATKFVQDHLLLRHLGLAVARIDGLLIFPSRLSVHGDLQENLPEGYINKMAQRVTSLNVSTHLQRLQNRCLNSSCCDSAVRPIKMQAG
jgi:hypothetical protein